MRIRSLKDFLSFLFFQLDTFAGYKIVYWQFILLALLSHKILITCCFDSYFCSSVYNMPCFSGCPWGLLFGLGRLNTMFLLCVCVVVILLAIELLRSVIWYQSLILENCLPLYFQIFFLSCSLSFHTVITHMLESLIMFQSSWRL